MDAPISLRTVQQWWDELERMANVIGLISPDEVCCDGLSQRQAAILRVLVSSEGARLMDLAAMSGISPSAMTRVLEKLEARGLVERVRGAQIDGRAAMVRVTAGGRRTRELLDRLMQQRTEQIIHSVPRKDRNDVLRALHILNDAMEASGCCALNAPVAQLAEDPAHVNGNPPPVNSGANTRIRSPLHVKTLPSSKPSPSTVRKEK